MSIWGRLTGRKEPSGELRWQFWPPVFENLEPRLLLDGAAFTDPVDFPVGDFPKEIVSADFNADGRPDLAVTNSDIDVTDVSILYGQADGTFAGRADLDVGRLPHGIVSGDFNADGRPDLAVTNWWDDDVSILYGQADGSFGGRTDFAVGNVPHGIFSGDFNADDRPDLAVTNWVDGDVSILYGQADGTFAGRADFDVGIHPQGIVSGDFNADGRPDLAVVNEGDDDVTILYGQADGTFAGRTDFAVGYVPQEIVSGDFNADGRPDLAVTNSYDDDVSILYGQADGTFDGRADFPVGDLPCGIVSADFDANGRADLAIANSNADDVSILYGQADGTFDARADFPAGNLPYGIVSADFNADGRPDLAVTNSWSFDVSILYGLNQAPMIGSLSDSPDPVTRGDTLTLTATSVADLDGTVAKVEFYRDANSNLTLDVETDTLLGEDTSSSGGWTWSGSTAAFATGSNMYFARAQDNDATWGDAAGATGMVTAVDMPTIGSLSDSPDPLTHGDTLALTANSVADPDGTVAKVEFYWDANGNGTLDMGTDTLLGEDTSSTGGWTWSGSTAGFAIGENTYFARAQDDDEDWSQGASTTGTVAAVGDEGDFVTRFYQECLQREPDADGLNNWVTDLNAGTRTGSDVAEGFMFSAEYLLRYRTDSEFVDDCYGAFFGREGDAPGKANWLAQLADGVSRQSVLNGFIYSQEFANLAQGFEITAYTEAHQQRYTVRLFVRRFYVECLQREADEPGLTYWADGLIDESLVGSQLAYNFIFSQEYLNRNTSNEEFVDDSYHAFFNREPDAPGKANWLAALAGGASHADVLKGFTDSLEFANLCGLYDILPNLP